jgi:hypothetical protein
MDTLRSSEKNRKRNRWLNEYGLVSPAWGPRSSIIVAKALSVVRNPTGWCVDFGTYDGRVCSNTFNFVALTTSSVNHTR